mgnify:CR=1 FL=1
MPRAGLEPARDKFPQDFKSCASTDFATKALVTLFLAFLLLTHNYSISISYLNYIVNTFFRFFYIFFKSVLYNQMQQKNILKKHSKNDTSKSLIKRSFLLCNFQKLKYMEKLLYSLIPFSAFSKFSDSHFPSTFTINAGKSCNITSSSVTFLASFSYMFILSSIATL